MKFSKKKNIISLIIIILLISSPFIYNAYNDYRKNSLEKEVEIYLNKRGYNKSDIVKLKPYRSLKGPEKYMVELELKGDKGGYNLYKDSKDNKIKVDVYVIDGEAHLVKNIRPKP